MEENSYEARLRYLLTDPVENWRHGEHVKISDRYYSVPQFLEIIISRKPGGVASCRITAYRDYPHKDTLTATLFAKQALDVIAAWKKNDPR